MNPTEAAALLAHCSGFDNRQPSVAAAKSWAAALHDVPFDQDARDAVASYYTTPSQNPNERLWILPHHIKTLRAKIRSKRLENFQYEPVADESVPEYLARLRGQTQAIASGRVPAPTGQLAPGKGEPPRELMAGLSDLGWQGNRTVDGDELEVELVDTVRRSGPLGVECPVEKCRAAIGKPCKGPGGSDKQPLGRPRSKPHSARLRAANGEGELTAGQLAVQEQAIKARSAQFLADIPDVEIVDEEAAS
ncbi:hypothetical protein [Streptomyces sp. NPDC005732]|uniref:zinc finger domain-containing protein n=1 Tax=Streptomyces sp. NPDC005732 TaxID=3157057 RepID=UPI0033F8FD65